MLTSASNNQLGEVNLLPAVCDASICVCVCVSYSIMLKIDLLVALMITWTVAWPPRDSICTVNCNNSGYKHLSGEEKTLLTYISGDKTGM